MDEPRSAGTGFAATIDNIRLIDLIQLLCLAQTSNAVSVECDLGRGVVDVFCGKISHAELSNGAQGERAFLEMLGWGAGRFEVLPLEELASASIDKPFEYLALQAVRLLQSDSGSNEGGAQGTPSTPLAGFAGWIELIGLLDFVQLVCSSQGDRLIEVESNGEVARIFVRSGQVTHAQFADLSGEEAFFAIVGLAGGNVRALVHAGEETVSIQKPWEYLLFEAVRLQDERSGVVDEEEAASETLYQAVQKMKLLDRIRLAMRGNKEARTILMRDPNRMIQLAIIKNPRISEGEVGVLANSRSVDEDILRIIAANREWVKLYPIRLALVKNPKTPLPLSARLIKTLMFQDLRIIAKSKSVPTGVAQAALRLVADHKD